MYVVNAAVGRHSLLLNIAPPGAISITTRGVPYVPKENSTIVVYGADWKSCTTDRLAATLRYVRGYPRVLRMKGGMAEWAWHAIRTPETYKFTDAASGCDVPIADVADWLLANTHRRYAEKAK